MEELLRDPRMKFIWFQIRRIHNNSLLWAKILMGANGQIRNSKKMVPSLQAVFGENDRNKKIGGTPTHFIKWVLWR